MVMVASYYAKVGVDVDKADFSRVDKYFDTLQRKILKFQTATGKLSVDVKPNVNVVAAAKTLQRQITLAMKDVIVPIRKFQIDGKALAAQISGTLATKGGSSRIRLNATLSQQSLQMMRQQVQSALNGMIISPRVRPVVAPTRGGSNAVNQRQTTSRVGTRGRAPSQQGMALGLPGGLGGASAFSRFGFAALPFFAGAYGLSALNSATQQVTLSDMASKGIFSNATMPNGSTRNVYENSNAWIRAHADTTGTNLREVLPAYQGFMAAAMPTMGYEPSQGIFKAFSQFGTVRGASKDSMQRALVAVQQMAGKGQVMSEELKGQLAEAQGFGELPQIFAAAYQKKTGGKLVGSEAYVALQEAMKKGSVKSDILLDVSKILREKSDPYIAAASQTSSAEQNRADNARFEFTSKFAKGGGDAGWAVIWKTVAGMTERASEHAATFGKYFEIASLYASNLLLTFEQLGGLWTGTGDTSFVTKLFGERNGKLLLELIDTFKKNLSDIFDLFTKIVTSSGFQSFLSSILNSFLNLSLALQNIVGAAVSLFKGDLPGAWDKTKKAGESLYYTFAYDDRNKPSFDTGSNSPLANYGKPAATPYANSPNSAINNNTTTNNQPISVVIQNPTIMARPDQTVSQAMAEMVANPVQVYTQDLKSALARSPQGPQ